MTPRVHATKNLKLKTNRNRWNSISWSKDFWFSFAFCQ